jgi:hypothetical protein
VLFSITISIRFNALADAGGREPIRAIGVGISTADGLPSIQNGRSPSHKRDAIRLFGTASVTADSVKSTIDFVR